MGGLDPAVHNAELVQARGSPPQFIAVAAGERDMIKSGTVLVEFAARCEEPPPNRLKMAWENAGPVTGSSLPPGDGRRQARVQRAAVIVTSVPSGAWGADPVPVLRLHDHYPSQPGTPNSSAGPDPGGSGRSPAAPIVATGAIVR